jgi:ABC-type multidrug transport system fused ATPase/permease subunit
MTFFDTTPSGRILSRFSRDVAVVDALLPSNVEGIYTTLLQLLGTVLLSIVAVPYMAIVLFLLCALYAYIQRYYSCSARELQRLESLKRSPVLTHFSETLDGRGTLRALGLGAAFEQKLIEVLDENSVTLYAQRIVERWLAVRLESMGATVSIFTALLSVIIAAHSKDLSAEDRRQVAALTGLALAYALALPGEMNWLVRQSVEFEARMNAVERIVEYSSIISERQGEEQAPRAWPASGAIEIKKLSVRYQPHLPLVLHEVSFEMKGGQKIGIVGRTGSGKSTLISCLFRLVDIEPGKILVDGVDIAALQLSELRKGLAVVPQNPVLFSGTLRDNIDPFGMFSDEEVRTAVEQSSLASTFTAVQMDESADSLQLVLSVGGSNLSQGQRQLVCLSRALLKRSQVLVLDEASSSVDMSTDASISQCIKQHFASATVITVAHRVHTIMESDVVLVLAGGHVVESGEPSVLASNPDSTFFKFIKGTE